MARQLNEVMPAASHKKTRAAEGVMLPLRVQRMKKEEGVRALEAALLAIYNGNWVQICNEPTQ